MKSKPVLRLSSVCPFLFIIKQTLKISGVDSRFIMPIGPVGLGTGSRKEIFRVSTSLERGPI